jgi:hypothetical protein
VAASVPLFISICPLTAELKLLSCEQQSDRKGIMTARFDLGQTVITAAADSLLDYAQRIEMLTRHVSGDWGVLDKEDKAANERAIKLGDRILSRYEIDGQAYYVITEWDRSVTTILRVEDY